MKKQIYAMLLLTLSIDWSCFSNEEEAQIDQIEQIQTTEETLPAQEQGVNQEAQALPSVPNIEATSPEDLKIFVDKIIEELKTSLNSILTQIMSLLRENENLKSESIAFQSSFFNLIKLNAQISPFSEINDETIKNPEAWMSIKDLIEQLGQDEKAEFESCMSKKFKLIELILVKSKTTTDLLNRFQELNTAHRALLEQIAAQYSLAKFENAFPSIQSNIDEIIEWRKSLDEKSAQNLELFFKKSLQLRKNIFAWFKLVSKGIYKHIHLPVHDLNISLPRVREMVTISTQYSKEMEKLAKKWTESELKA